MPIRGRKYHQKSRGVGRGKMFLADRLGWIPGYPLDSADGMVRWMSVPDERGKLPEAINLTRESLHDATYTWSKLTHQFPHALPSIIDNLGRWHSHLPQLLEWLKGAIHRGEPLPADLFTLPGVFNPDVQKQALELQKGWPEGKALIDAFGWLNLLRPHLLKDGLDWLAAHRAKFSIILKFSDSPASATLFMCKLWELHRREDGRNLDSLLLVASHPFVWHLAREPRAIEDYLNGWKRTLNLITKNKRSRQKIVNRPTYPTKKLDFEITGFVDHLFLLNKNKCSGTLAIFDLLYPNTLLDEWEAWHGAVLAAERQAIGLFRQWEQQAPVTQGDTKPVMAEIERLKLEFPVACHFEKVFESLKDLANPKYHHLFELLPDFLQTLPQILNGGLLRLTALSCIGSQRKWVSVQTLAGFTAAHIRYSKSFGNQPDRFLLWQDICEAHKSSSIKHASTPIDCLGDGQFSQSQMGGIFQAWGANLTQKQFPPTVKRFDQFCDLVDALNDVEAAVLRTKHLHDEGFDGYLYTPKNIRLAHEWSPNGKLFINIMQNLDMRSDYDIAQLSRVNAELENGGWVNVVQELVAAGYFNRLVELSKRIDVNLSADLAVGPPSALAHKPSPSWLSRFPADFHPVINTLNSFTSAEKTLSLTENVLGKTFPDPAELRREIEHLERLVKSEPENEGLSKRLVNLKKRQTAPKALSDKKVENLNKKLVRLVHSEMLNVWEAELKESAYFHLSEQLKVKNLPDALVSTHGSLLLPNIRKLRQPFRDLGFRLLSNRCGPRPWLMAHEPANQKFVNRLTKLGISMEPWLNPPEPQQMVGENGQTVIINFEDDPIELLHMGGYFNTCLSPGSFNFYSTTVNAADINKHVIFGRNKNGSVVGRCLIGLTNEGGIVTFHPYCHDGKLGFEQIILKVVQQLANEMGSIVLPKGIVEPIMAPDWYDDGPRDLAQSFSFLNFNSPFRATLSTISVDEFIPNLEEVFAPVSLNGLTLTLVANLQEVQARPELLAELLPLMRKYSKSITDQTWFKMLRGLVHVGQIQEAREIIITKAVPYQIRCYKMYHHEGYIDFGLLDIMIELEPIVALQTIRQTRDKHIRSDLDEWLFERARALIKIYEKLNRPNKRKLLEEKWSKNIAKMID